MLQDEMSVDVSDLYDETVLHGAIESNRTDGVKQLLGGGADLNRQIVFKATPLHYAARRNYTDVARLLINNGADINLKNDHIKTPLDEARKGSEVERQQSTP